MASLPSLPSTPLSSITDLLTNLKTFNHRLPTYSNLISTILSNSPTPPTTAEQLLSDALNTRILVPHRLIPLIAQFLQIKRSLGSPIERKLYTDMSSTEFIKRLITKRPLSFMYSNDETIGRNGAYIRDAERLWSLVGTEKEEWPLILEEYLSYEEIAISALLGVSSPTYFINSGGRNNCGDAGKKGEFEERGIYIALVGARFEKLDQMESRFIIQDKELWTPERGYGFHTIPKTQEQFLLQMWARFYGIKNEDGVFGFPVVTKESTEIDMERYKTRIGITLETFLLEANSRGEESVKKVHAFLVGLGLGVWQFTPDQKLAYIESLIRVVSNISIPMVEIIEVSFVLDSYNGESKFHVPSRTEAAKDSQPRAQSEISEPSERDTSGTRDIEIHLTRNDPACKREGDRLLVASYAWDGNAFPGNEIWRGSLSGSGDPAAICCSTVGELQNAYVNPFWGNIKILGKSQDEEVVGSAEFKGCVH